MGDIYDLDTYKALKEDDGEPADTTSTSLGDKLEEAFRIKLQIDELDIQKSALNKKLEAIELFITDKMETEGLDKIECSLGSGKVKVEPYPNIKDWNAFMTFVANEKRFELVEKRVGKKAFREFMQENGEIPDGIDVFMKRRVEFRKKAVRKGN